jgi:hypothetical protein
MPNRQAACSSMRSFQRSRRFRKQARKCPPAAARNRDACAAPWCRGHRRRRARIPCAASTSSADQRAARSSPTALRAPGKLPSGLGLRGQMWPLSIWVWQSTKAGNAMPPRQSIAVEAPGPAFAGRISRIVRRQCQGLPERILRRRRRDLRSERGVTGAAGHCSDDSHPCPAVRCYVMSLIAPVSARSRASGAARGEKSMTARGRS